MNIKYTLPLFIIMYSSCPLAKDVNIGFSAPKGDKGRYVIIEISRAGAITKTLHVRYGEDSTDYTRTEINCIGMQYRVMGTAEDSPNKIKIKPSNWADFAPGSSKHLLAITACGTQL
jgi:hypothetical protein